MNENVSAEILNDYRQKFLDKYSSQIQSNLYDERDLNRLKEDNTWIHAFYMHVRGKHEIIVDLIHDVLTWRKEFDANGLIRDDGQLPYSVDLIKKGGLFMRNTDKKGVPLLHFSVKQHKKDAFPHEQVCKFIAYHLERNYKFSWSNQIVLFFDMVDAGLSNLDMDMIKFVITCLKINYPGLIDYMLIFQMPFLFNAAWKIIKNWLPPEAIKIIKFVDKKSIREYVNEDQLFLHMGGLDAYTFKYEPQAIVTSNTSEIRKRVSFVSLDALPEMHKATKEQTHAPNETINRPSVTTNTIYLSISPADEIVFVLNESKVDLYQTISLNNTSVHSIAYKIKITSPDKFRVKPGSGVLGASQSVQISINFLKEFHYSVTQHRDKFLIQWTKMDDSSLKIESNEFWKHAHANKSQINEYKLRCVVIKDSEARTNDSLTALPSTPKDTTLTTEPRFYNLNHQLSFESAHSNGTHTNVIQSNGDKELNSIKSKLDSLTAQNTRLNQKFTLLIYLLYILIFINLMQILFESNFYNLIVQPFIEDKFLGVFHHDPTSSTVTHEEN